MNEMPREIQEGPGVGEGMGPEVGITRVMSPSPGDGQALVQLSTGRSPRNEGLLIAMAVECQACHTTVCELVMCMECGVYGHPVCLHIERFQGYPFCGACLGRVVTQFAQFQDGVRREEWTQSLSSQLTTWRRRVTEAP